MALLVQQVSEGLKARSPSPGVASANLVQSLAIRSPSAEMVAVAMQPGCGLGVRVEVLG